MKRVHLNIAVCLFSLLLTGTISKPLDCTWNSPSGEFYDFSDLKRDGGYQIKDTSSTMGMFDLIYVTNVCESVNCSNTDVSLYQGLEILGKVTTNCDILTHANPPTYSYINADQPAIGVQWQFSGDQCTLPPKISYDESNNLITTPVQSTEIHSSTYQIFCSEDASETFTVEVQQNCHITLKMTSPLGCIGASRSRYIAFKILLFVIFVAAVYFVGGSQINTRKYGLTGIESLPHHAFWTDLPSLVNDGFRFTLLQLTAGLRYFKAKGTGTAQASAPGTYNTI